MQEEHPRDPSFWPTNVHKALRIISIKHNSIAEALDEAFSGYKSSMMLRSTKVGNKSVLMDILSENLEEMPTYMGSANPDIRVLVKWRLGIGK